MNTNRISLITLAVKNLQAQADFYAALGWRQEFQSEHVVFYDLGGQKFGLYVIDMLANDLNKTPDQMGTGAQTLTVNFASKGDVDAAYDAALAAGGTALKRPDDIFWGGYTGSWADPEGHVWEYAWNPYWTLDAEGRITS
ncbi:glyoxalase [Actibacterium mucosum KCTC 23349]|uniref:Glyoxalase n=1 Tax=Actibacterium mucosum KCTC 23349 TaxID=1454373 RepID=A0A037ZR96_9RHOB|nr:VOC family protein [Actibacterium mucosum]KAJ57367.1 glyoxalase [Actibacterium mucosum KCTC 23349]